MFQTPKLQIINTKLQTKIKHQITKNKQFEILNFENCNLFGILEICNLEFL